MSRSPLAPGPGPHARPRGAFAWPLLAASLAAILLATLRPSRGDPTLPVSWCIFCGEQPAADAIANILLFLPLGVAGALLTSPAATIAGAALLSTCVEIAQIALPGRDPSLRDVLTNTLGAAAGVLVVLAARRLRGRKPPVWTPAAVGAAAALLVTATGIAFRPSPPGGVYYGQWTARLGHLAAYEGRVKSATLGGLELPGHRLADARPVAAALVDGAPLEVRALAGPPPPRLAPLFSIFNDAEEEVLLLGLDGGDVVYRIRARSQAIGLDAPDIRVRRAAAGLSPGTPLNVQVEHQGTDVCVVVNAQRSCGLASTPGRGWALIYYDSGFPGWLKRALDLASIAVLLVLFGWTTRRDLWTLGGALLAGAALYAIPPRVGLLPASPAETAAALAGLTAGLLASAILRGRAAPPATARASSLTQRSIRA